MTRMVIRSSRYITSRIYMPSICFARRDLMTRCRCLPNSAQVGLLSVRRDTFPFVFWQTAQQYAPIAETSWKNFVHSDEGIWIFPVCSFFLTQLHTCCLLCILMEEFYTHVHSMLLLHLCLYEKILSCDSCSNGLLISVFTTLCYKHVTQNILSFNQYRRR